MMRILTAAFLCAVCFGCSKDVSISPDTKVREETKVITAPTPRPTYSKALRLIAAERRKLAVAYSKAGGPRKKADVLADARRLFVSSVSETMFPYWYGTPWDFNGTTEVPGKGTIACGYFVTTVLRDVGVQLDRVKLAQAPSEQMIKSLTTEQHIKRFSNAPINGFVSAVKKWGPGLYVVGLDTHTGFVLHDGADVFFVHSSPAQREGVVKEQASKSAKLIESKYRVLGRISADDAFLLKWLDGGT